MKIIIHQPLGHPVCVTSVLPGIDLKAEAVRIVPSGLPFWIVDSSILPNDRSDRRAWEIDLNKVGPADGVGGEV